MFIIDNLPKVLNNEDVVNLDQVNQLLDQASNKRLGPVFDKFAVTSVERCSQVWTNQKLPLDKLTNQKPPNCDIAGAGGPQCQLGPGPDPHHRGVHWSRGFPRHHRHLLPLLQVSLIQGLYIGIYVETLIKYGHFPLSAFSACTRRCTSQAGRT